MIAQTDHPYILEWLGNAKLLGGSFISSISTAALVADDDNYPLLKPVIETLRVKYPSYEPTEGVKAELADAVKQWEWARQVAEHE